MEISLRALFPEIAWLELTLDIIVQPTWLREWMFLLTLSLIAMGGCHSAHKKTYEICPVENPCPVHIACEDPVYQDSVDDNNQVMPVSFTRDILKKEKWKLTLKQAVIISLDNNKDIAVFQYLPEEKRGEIAIEFSEFDPDLTLGGNWQRTDQQVANITSSGSGVGNPAVQNDLFGAPQGLTDQLGLTKKMQTGTRASVYYGTNYTLTDPAGDILIVNPGWDSRLNFQLEQPLFKDHGRDVNLLGVEIANANYHVSQQEFQQNVSRIIRDVELAYWNILAAETDLYSRQLGVDESTKTLEVEESKFQNGLNSIADVAQAREQFQSLKAELAVAKQNLADKDRDLRKVMGIRAEDGRRIVPVSDSLNFENLPDWDYGTVTAMQQRPELQAQRSAIYSAKLGVDRACNNLEHDLKAFAGYTLNGLDNNYDESTSTLFRSNYTDWSLGFRYERRIGQRAEKAKLYQAERILLKERAQLRKLKHDIKMELHEAFQAIYATKDIVHLQQKRKEAAFLQLRAQEELYRKGQANLDLYLRTQLTYLNAMREEKRAVSNYNQAQARWAFATANNLYGPDLHVEQPMQSISVDQVFNGPAIMPVPSENSEPENSVENDAQ